MPEIADGEFLLVLYGDGNGRPQPFLSFWTSNAADKNRRLDLHWIAGQEQVASAVEEIIRRHGGLIAFGGCGRTT